VVVLPEPEAPATLMRRATGRNYRAATVPQIAGLGGLVLDLRSMSRREAPAAAAP
jgi:hypothetical protein